MQYQRLLLVSLLLAVLPAVQAHSMSRDEAVAHNERQQAMYHCIPAVQSYTLARKQMQQAPFLKNPIDSIDDPTVTRNLFLDQPIADRMGSLDPEQADVLLSCSRAAREFKMKNSTCVLAPEVTEGPYFHSQGHPIRSNMAEYQIGLPFLMNIGVIDVETCKPVPNVLVDVWLANATGYYSGHPLPHPNLKDEKPAAQGPRKGMLSAYPKTNERENWLRAAYPTDKNGVVQFTSIFPGYYTGRATHVHTKVFSDWTPLPNGSYVGGPLAHIGQFFFEDDLNDSVDKMWPYSTNPIRDTHGRTRNWVDGLNIFNDAHMGGYQPVFDIEMMGHVISQGLVGYVTMGINLTQAHASSAWDPYSSKPKFG